MLADAPSAVGSYQRLSSEFAIFVFRSPHFALIWQLTEQIAAHSRISKITTFTEQDHDSLQTLLGDLPRMKECPDVECLKRSILQLTPLDLELLAKSECEHGFVLHEMKLSLESVNILINRIKSELRKGANGNPHIIGEDYVGIVGTLAYTSLLQSST